MYLKRPRAAVVVSIYPHMFGDILSFTLIKEKRTHGKRFRKSLDSNALAEISLINGWILTLSESRELFYIYVADEGVERAEV